MYTTHIPIPHFRRHHPIHDYVTNIDHQYRPRNMVVSPLPNGQVRVDCILRDDGAGCESRNNPDVPCTFYGLNTADAEYWFKRQSELSAEFHEFLQQNGIRRNQI